MNGFSSGSTDEAPQGNRRVLSEGREYYERNTQASDWFAPHGDTNKPQPEARLRSDAARDNAIKNRGTMGESMGGYANPVASRSVHPRGVRPEAEATVAGSKGGSMKTLMEDYGRLAVDPTPQPKVKGCEAQEYKQREQGSTKILLDHYSTEPLPGGMDMEKCPQPRLGHGAGEIADKHKGGDMGPLMRLEGKKTQRSPRQGPLHKTSTGAGWDEIPPQVRSRPEGESIAQKNSADSMGEILEQNNLPPPRRKEGKVLKHMEQSDMSSKVPNHRVRHDGIQNFERANNRENMTAIMHGGSSAANDMRPRSGKKVMPHMQRSELW